MIFTPKLLVTLSMLMMDVHLPCLRLCLRDAGMI